MLANTIKVSDVAVRSTNVKLTMVKFNQLLQDVLRYESINKQSKARFPLGEFVRATRSENKNPAT